MKFNKFIIKESHEFFTYVFNMCDKDENVYSAIRMNSMTSKIKPFVYNGSAYVVEKKSALSPDRLVYKDGVYIGKISHKLYSYDFRIFTDTADYTIVSNYNFKNITLMEGRKEVGKASRKTHWFTSNFGIAIFDDVDPVLVMLAMVLKLYAMRVGMAA